MLGVGQLKSVATGTSTIAASGGAESALLSIGLSGGTASAAATFTVQNGGTSATQTFVVQSIANGYSNRHFVAGIQFTQLTASVASNGNCDVELM